MDCMSVSAQLKQNSEHTHRLRSRSQKQAVKAVWDEKMGEQDAERRIEDEVILVTLCSHFEELIFSLDVLLLGFYPQIFSTVDKMYSIHTLNRREGEEKFLCFSWLRKL